jgi:Spy/CpxP family protein refolding chaperone
LIVALGLVCASVLLLAAAPKKKVTPKPSLGQARQVVSIDPALRVPDAAWRRVALTPAQKQRFRPLEARFYRDQRQMLHGIGPKGAVLRRELQIASTTPGQAVRAVKLRQEILRLTAPLQERHAEFVREAKAMLTPQQRRQLDIASTRVKAEQAAARRVSRGNGLGGAR